MGNTRRSLAVEVDSSDFLIFLMAKADRQDQGLSVPRET